MHARAWSENSKGQNLFEDLSIDGKITSQCILKSADYIWLAEVTNQRWVLVKIVMNLWVLLRGWNCMSNWQINNFSCWSLLPAVNYVCVSVYALAQLYNVTGDVSGIARRGSGSACRSLYGGFVQWHHGSACDGSDSIATQLAPQSHWPEMRILVLVVNIHQWHHRSSSKRFTV
jgi:hypothetical protein